MRDRGYARPVESPTVTARSEHDKFRRGPELGGRGSIIAKLDLEAATNPCPEEPQPSGAPPRPALSLADGRPGKRLAGVLRDAPCGAPQPTSWPGRGRENAMLRQIWNAYRGWAKAARDLQSQTQRWNLAALICVIAAAVFGAIASVAPTTLSAWVAGAAAVASAVGAYFGRQIVGAGEEAGWIQARATAATPSPTLTRPRRSRPTRPQSPSRRPTRGSCVPTIRFPSQAATSASRPTR